MARNRIGREKLEVDGVAPKLVIAVDCGTTARKEVTHLLEQMRLDVIVLDHHEPEKTTRCQMPLVIYFI